MARQPMRRKAGQSVATMTEQLLADKEQNRLYRPQYNEISAAQKAQALEAAIAHQQELLRRADDRGRVNLDDLDAVKRACNEYMESCRQAGVYPSMTALAPSLGYSRQGLYLFMSKHDTEVTKYLDALRSSMAAIVQQAGLSRMASEAMSIFILKNSAGMSDKLDVNATAVPATAEDQRMTAEEIAKRYITEIDVDSVDSDTADIASRYAQEDADQWP